MGANIDIGDGSGTETGGRKRRSSLEGAGRWGGGGGGGHGGGGVVNVSTMGANVDYMGDGSGTGAVGRKRWSSVEGSGGPGGRPPAFDLALPPTLDVPEGRAAVTLVSRSNG